MASIYFTLEEAQGYVNWLEEKFGVMEPLTNKTIELKDKIQNLKNGIRSNGGGSVVEKMSNYRNELDEVFKVIDQNIQSIHGKGILIKNVEHGLVDFPSMRDGREVYLCWNAGEKEIRYWHDVNVGFSGRQPL